MAKQREETVVCSVCANTVAISADGTLPPHRMLFRDQPCRGAGAKVERPKGTTWVPTR
jgi:hypothetical protein